MYFKGESMRPRRPGQVHWRALRLLLAGAIGTSLALGGGAVLGNQIVTESTVLAMSPEMCQQFISEMHSGREAFSAADQERIDSATAQDCFYVLRHATTQTSLPLGLEAASAATTCKTDQRSMGLYVLGIEIATARADIYWCWNGSTAWHSESTHYEWCRVTSMPLWFGDDEWCGASPNNQATIDLGMDFYVAAYAAPWWHRYGWMRWSGSKSGVSGATRGFCCN